MTPTRHALDEALPPVPSGISALGGDLTEPDEPGSDRAVALNWLEDYYRKAQRKQAMAEITEIAERVGADETRTYSATIDAVHDACQTLDDERRRYGPRRGDRWESRNGRAVIVGSNDWPGPAKGTHESDLEFGWPNVPAALIDGDAFSAIEGRGGWREYDIAKDWSRTPEREEAK